MTCLWTLYRANLLGMLSACVAVAIVAACASTAAPLPDESLLSAAGFKVVVAKTTQQQEHLQSLPPGKIRAMERNGKPFYVYPDAAKNQIYVGTQKQYQAYLRLDPQYNGNVQSQLNAQQAADLAAYGKQDVAVQKETKKDLADPYYFWPSWDELVW
jgi:hypothetical protein